MEIDVAFRFPHMRGDGPFAVHAYSMRQEFSPHAWGWSDNRRKMRETAAVFPTCVGMVRMM